MKDWHRELGIREVPPDEDEQETLQLQIEEENDAISYIVESMQHAEEHARADKDQGRKIDLRLHREDLRRLLREASRLYCDFKADYLRRNSAEGSDWRPHRQLEKNLDSEEHAQEPGHDYGERLGVKAEATLVISETIPRSLKSPSLPSTFWSTSGFAECWARVSGRTTRPA